MAAKGIKAMTVAELLEMAAAKADGGLAEVATMATIAAKTQNDLELEKLQNTLSEQRAAIAETVAAIKARGGSVQPMPLDKPQTVSKAASTDGAILTATAPQNASQAVLDASAAIKGKNRKVPMPADVPEELRADWYKGCDTYYAKKNNPNGAGAPLTASRGKYGPAERNAIRARAEAAQAVFEAS